MLKSYESFDCQAELPQLMELLQQNSPFDGTVNKGILADSRICCSNFSKLELSADGLQGGALDHFVPNNF